MATHEETRQSATANDSPNRSANNSELTPNATANKAEPFGERDAQQWRSVQEIALMEGLTERAIQKRCQRGYYVARLVEGDKGEVWEIDENSIKQKRKAPPSASPDDGEHQAEPTANRSGSDAEPQGERTPNDGEPASKSPNFIPFGFSENSKTRDRDAEEIARQREEIIFLRGLVEQRDRDAAELRASLREALRAMPKQLSQGTPVETATPPTAAPETAPSAPQIGQTVNTATPTPDNAKSPANRREARPLWRVILGIR